MPSIESAEFAAGPDQLIVVYLPQDTGEELDPLTTFQAIADDAARRADRGEWIVTMAVMPLRHAGAAFSNASGYETKTAIAVTYGRAGTGSQTPNR